MNKLDKETVYKIADILDECVECHKIHEYQNILGKMSWADPKDGHSYRTRLTAISQRPEDRSVTKWIRNLAPKTDEL